ncbi:unnamed protein product [Lampetra fluviatilis]
MATQLLPTPGAVAPVIEPTTGANVAPAVDGAAEPVKQLRPDDPWQRVETHLGALTTALLRLVALVMPIAAGGSPVVDRLGVDMQRAGDGASEGPPLLLREVSPSIATPTANESADRGRRLPHVREFVAAGSDWSAFRWRFEAAYKSIRWSEEEALITLPTMLDNDALAVFQSIPAEKKKMLTQAFQEMAEVYEPPDDRTRKFQHPPLNDMAGLEDATVPPGPPLLDHCFCRPGFLIFFRQLCGHALKRRAGGLVGRPAGTEPAPRSPMGRSALPGQIQEHVGCAFPGLDNEQLRQAQQRDPDLAAVEAALREEKVAIQGPWSDSSPLGRFMFKLREVVRVRGQPGRGCG